MEDRNTCNTTPAGDWEKPESRDTLANNIPFHKRDGGIECIIAYSINLITAELLFFDMGAILNIFGGALKHNDICCPDGIMDLLLRVHEVCLFPITFLQSIQNCLLCQSVFGTGHLLVGHHPFLVPRVVDQSPLTQTLLSSQGGQGEQAKKTLMTKGSTLLITEQELHLHRRARRGGRRSQCGGHMGSL